ncbi:MAG: hypothetical protein RBT36_11905 [Desulfobulbus sp.]|jgi:hypothetical protein|nr:hypothetical protein [Desulfobulbus sp.]
MNRIEDLIKEMKRLEAELLEELAKKETEFSYQVRGHRVLFGTEARRYQRLFVVGVARYLRHASVINIISAPFIWLCIIPALLLDLSISVYQAICFRLYRIPQVQRSHYIVIDRHSLSYLNLIEKINCVYCGYFNGLIPYVQEIAARTEQYWCPIKHARRVAARHSRYHKFLEYGDCTDYHERLQALRRDFADLEEEP